MASEEDQRPAAGRRCGTFSPSLPLICALCVSGQLGPLIPPFVAGAELLVEQLGPGVGAQEKENHNVFLVGATLQRLLSGAEEAGLFKEYNDGSMRGFTSVNKQNFTDFVGNVQ